MKTSPRAWAAAGVLSVAVVAALLWRFVATSDAYAGNARSNGGHTSPDARGDRAASAAVGAAIPVVSADPGHVTVAGGAVPTVSWELSFPQGVWSLRFTVGSPNVALRFLDLSGAVSEDCHALSAVTERGPAPFPNASFVEATHTAELADMPIEVVEALTRARELTLVACDTRFQLDDAQQRVLIDFYVQVTGVILDALSVDAGTAPSVDGGPAGAAP